MTNKTKNNQPGPFDEEKEVKLAQEAEWVQRASQGDEVAFDKLYETYIEYIFNFFFSRTRSSAISEALTSQTFTNAALTLIRGHYNHQDKPFKLWLYTISSNVLLEHGYELHDIPAQGMRDILWLLTRGFSSAERQILAMRHVDSLSEVEIALLLNSNEKDCRKLYYQTLVKLKQVAQERGLWDEIVKGEQELTS